jgi:hypothetical protein
MPLDGFHVVQWASMQFGALSSIWLGGLAILVLIIGVSIGVTGARQVPFSWALVCAGLATCVIAYFIVGTAINNTGSIQQNASVNTAAWRYGPYCVATILVGLGGFTFRLSLRAWSSDESSGKVFGVALFLLFAALVFAGVQVGRGASAPSNGPAPERPIDPDEASPVIRPDYGDTPVRRRVVAPLRR